MARKPSGPPLKPQSKRPVSASRITAPAGKAAPAVVAAPARKLPTPDAPRQGSNPITWITGLPKFAAEVRAEARKITWTSRRETWITSVMVFMMVVITAVFFLIVDQVLGQGMHLLLNLAA
jgi:preprotein translocase subunit SecE